MLQDQTCGRCGRFSLPPGEELSKHGFGRCQQLRPYQWRSQTSPCTFTPSRHEPAKAPA